MINIPRLIIHKIEILAVILKIRLVKSSTKPLFSRFEHGLRNYTSQSVDCNYNCNRVTSKIFVIII